jgi:cation diffusion facilitator CzcD-associated flavoprotein CzcO
MLQRTPTFFRTGRNAIEIAETLRELNIDETWIHEITRRKIMHDQTTFTARCRSEPEEVRDELIGNIRDLLGPDYDVEKHFTPPYRPWRQRIAFVPDADLFKSIADGKASVVTSEIDKFVSEGIQLESGEILEADVIVTATGFNMNVMGDIDFAIDSVPLNFHDTITYRGMMFTGVPNLAWVFGYFRGSWTIRSEIIAGFVCRLLNHMKKNGAKSVEPALRKTERDMALFDWMDDEDFNPNYLKRALPLLPRRGDSFEWRHTQDHWREQTEFPLIDLDDEVFIYHGTDNSILAAE